MSGRRLVFERKPVRIGLARLASSVVPGIGATIGALSIDNELDLEAPTDEWLTVRPRLAGICGSDLALIDGTASAYFDPLVSYPFTPGHEIVGDVDTAGGSRRVAVIPVLHCLVRGISPVCASCASGATNRCERVAFGHLGAGLQTGFCADTGGGWADELVAHPAQLIDVADDLSDDDAVLIEPTACAVHAAKHYHGQSVVVIGAGTVGLLTLAAISARRQSDDTAPIIVTARYPEQRRLAKELGADIVCGMDELPRWVRSSSSALVVGDQLTCGCDTVFDCVGSSDTLQASMRVVQPGGDVIAVGMPGNVSLELTSLWHREASLRGCYAYTAADFTTAMDVIRRFGLGRLVTAKYALDDYTDAIAHAAAAGRRGATKIVFDVKASS